MGGYFGIQTKNKNETRCNSLSMKIDKINFLFLLMVFFSGCKTSQDEPKPANFPTVYAEAVNNGVVDFAGSIEISYTAKYGDSLAANGIRLPDLTGMLKLDNVRKDTLIVFVLYYTTNGSSQVSSKKYDLNITVNPETILSVKLAADTTSIVAGQPITLNWTTNRADVVWLMIKPLSEPMSEILDLDKNGSLEVFPTENTLYTLMVQNKFGKDSSMINILARLPNMKDTLCNFGSWQFVKLRFQNGPDLPWYNAELDDCAKDNIMTFTQNPDIVYFHRTDIPCYEGEPDSQGSYTLEGNVFHSGYNMSITIIKLTQDTLVWRYYFEDQTATEETYIHPVVE